jgi:nucleoid-associated protein YgaU
MSSIAEDWFGDRNKWRFIAQANPLTDPDRLQVGQKLRLPPKDYKPEDDRAPAAKAAEVPANVHVVQSGDTLRKIARSRYGDAGKWQLIYDANRKAIGDDPGALKVGQRLTIPPAPAAKKPA